MSETEVPIVPGTEEAVAEPHPERVAMDEVENLRPEGTVLTVGRDDLLGPFGTAAGLAAKKHHIESFKWVHLVTQEGNDDGYFEASNGQSSIRVSLTGHTAGGAIDAFLPTRLYQVLKAMPQGAVQMEFGGGKVIVHGTSEGDARFELALLAPDGEQPKLGTGHDLEWESRPLIESEMIDAMTQAARFASNDQARQNLMSVLVKQDENEIIVSSSDSYRMFIERRAASMDLQGAGSFSVPRPAIGALAQFGMLKMAWDDNRVYLSDGQDLFFATVRIQGDVPDFMAMVNRIAESEGADIMLPREGLLASLAQVGVLATPHSNTVVMEFSPLNIHVSLQSGDDVAQASMLADVPLEDDERVGFNIAFLKDALTLFDEQEIKVHYVSAIRPAVFSSDDGSRQYMLATVRLP